MEMAKIMTEKMTMKDKHDKITIKGRPQRQTHYFQVLLRLLLYIYIPNAKWSIWYRQDQQ